VAARRQRVYLGGMRKAYPPLYARVEALPLPRAERELAMAWLMQAEIFAALVYGATQMLHKLIPARSARGSRSSGLRSTASN
jgi:hypothetical protein